MPGFSPPSGAAQNSPVVILGRRRIGILDVSTGSLSAGRSRCYPPRRCCTITTVGIPPTTILSSPASRSGRKPALLVAHICPICWLLAPWLPRCIAGFGLLICRIATLAVVVRGVEQDPPPPQFSVVRADGRRGDEAGKVGPHRQ